jgi:hypothetical protein
MYTTMIRRSVRHSNHSKTATDAAFIAVAAADVNNKFIKFHHFGILIR